MLINKELIARIDLKRPSTWVATWFGCGMLRPAPGTWGTLGAIPFGLALYVLGGWGLLLAATIAISLIGYWAADRYEKMTGEHDAGPVVIDEVAGMWIPMMLAGTNILLLIAAFLLFRFFDILKPWPISWFDQRPGAFGVMADDIVAGIAALACLWGIMHVFAG